MSFLRAIISAIRNYANFSGRSNRREFWYWLAFAILVWGVLLQIDIRYFATYFDYLPFEEGAPRYLSWAWVVFCILPTITLIVRRVHDHDKPGWMALTVLPLVWWLLAKGTKGPNRYG